MRGLWDGPAWRDVPPVEIANFRPESSAHRPQTQCKLLYSSGGLFGLFQVHDRYVRCIRTEFQDEVYKDSCVEFFVQPNAKKGYFNFEFNCGGTLRASYVTDPTRLGDGLKEFVPLDAKDDKGILRYHSLPQTVEPEITETTVWSLEFYLPFEILEEHVGELGAIEGQAWRANFYKCGDESSHPHWATWAPVPVVNFHLPENFGYVRFKP